MKFSKTFLIFTSLIIATSLFCGSFESALAATTAKKSNSTKTAVAKKSTSKKKTKSKKSYSVNLNPPRITLETAPHSEKKVSKKKKTAKKSTVKKKA